MQKEREWVKTLTCTQNIQVTYPPTLKKEKAMITANRDLARPQMETFISGGGVQLEREASGLSSLRSR